METTLSHNSRLANEYKGAKGRKACWVEEWESHETFIPKYREPEEKPDAPSKSKYFSIIQECQRRLDAGDYVVEIKSDNPSKLCRSLIKASQNIAPSLRYSTNTKGGYVTVFQKHKA